jgi:3-isopropylmalate/(R)-2-methylmalate dehydratase large subunit
LHLLHEVTSPQAFAELERRNLPVRRPGKCLATIDHAVPTLPADSNGLLPYVSDEAQAQVDTLQQNCARHGIKLHDWNSAERGIVHIIGPELGATQPGMVVVCGDSHTSTHGAFGSFALAIGTSEVGHVLASQCILQRKPANMEIIVDGPLGTGVSAKDVILHIISQIGVDGATGMVIEYRGSTIAAMDMDERMTLCNMSIECGAKAGLVAPDEVTTDFIKGRKLAPRGVQWDQAVRRWLQLKSDPDARFDFSRGNRAVYQLRNKSGNGNSGVGKDTGRGPGTVGSFELHEFPRR